jgi:hypothetical protein
LTTASPAQALNQKPLTAFPKIFLSLQAPPLSFLPGVYRAEFVGPGWLRAIAPKGLGLIHLAGWWGKELRADGTGANLVSVAGAIQPSLQVRFSAATSMIDGKPVVAVRYAADAPFPWPHIVDELRSLDDRCLLGMTLVDAPLLRKLPLPFLLQTVERPHGL